MSLPHIQLRALLLTVVGFAAGLGLIEQAAAQEPPLQVLRAPFVCDTEWSGGTRPGHGLNNWNLDINRTSLTFADPQHDLGQPLIAQADGTIVWIGQHYSAGTYVEIDYGDITVRYIHLVDGSVPDGLAIDGPIAEGVLFGLLGDSGNATHAHLHLEYFDSRAYDDARAYLLPGTNQIQIAMDGELIDPGEAFTSTNCSSTTTTSGPPHPFVDVDPDSYAYEDVGLLFDLAITTGTSDTSYSPADNVTREQMAAFLGRMWQVLNPADAAATIEALHVPDDSAPAGDPYPFTDVDPDSFAYDHIAVIYDLGITTGTSASTYSPADNVTREQMAAFLGRMRALLESAEPPDPVDPLGAPNESIPLAVPYPFADVDPDSFAYDHIARIHELVITTGTSASTYSPADNVTREQMAAFLARIYRIPPTD